MVSVAILGSTGMLGNAVADYFISKENYITYTSYRNRNLKINKDSFYFDANTNVFNMIPQSDYIINCIGIIKPYMTNNVTNAVLINSLFPHKLSKWCRQANKKLIHITTDCVFSGKDGKYTEESLHDCLDDYGKSKSLGEPKNCMVLRTSIIGEEIHQNASLIEWVKSNRGKKIKGYTNHLWNGVTTTQFANVCDQIIQNNMYEEDLFHIHSNDINKYELVSSINKHFDLNIDIEPFVATPCDRALRSIKRLNSKLVIPPIDEQIKTISSLSKQ